MRRIILAAAAAALAAAALAAPAPAGASNGGGSDYAFVCFARTSLTTNHGTWEHLPFGSPTTFELHAPVYQAGAGTDGHGVLVLGVGFQNEIPPDNTCGGTITNGNDAFWFCFARSAVISIPTASGTANQQTSPNFYENRAPSFYTGSGNDGHGLRVLSGGFDDGSC